MREIKFRGKSVDSEKWIYGGIAISNGKYFIAETTKDGYINLKEVIPETVGQSIDSKDKNGREIYEGHIVEIIQRDIAGKVFDEQRKGIEINDFSFLGFLKTLKPSRIEVIGNIYHNPELLN
jgi:uncharacterized phage protein (TIGR01671 family)